MFTASLTDFKQAFLGKQVVGDASMFFCAPDAVIRQEIEAWALMPLSVSCEWHTKRFQGVGEIQWGASLVRCSFASKLQSCQCLFVGRVFWQPRPAQQSSTSRAMVVPSSRSRTCWATSCE